MIRESLSTLALLLLAVAAGMWRGRHEPNPPQWPKPPSAPQHHR